MDKKKREEVLKLCKKLDGSKIEGDLFTLDSKKAVLNVPRFSTGIEDLDSILGGGIPKGRIVEISGVESSGKTSLALHLCGLQDMALFVSAEGTFDPARAKLFGNKKGQLIVYRPHFGEDALDRVLEFTRAGIPLIVVDSVPALMPREDYDKASKSFENEFRIGGVARILNKALPLLERETERSGTTIIFINQVRDKMNPMPFGEKTDTPGGRALKFYCSLRIQVARRAWIEIPNKDPRNTAANEKIGLITKCKVIKSKVCNPYGECQIAMIFDMGYVSNDDVLTIRKEKMAENRKKKNKASLVESVVLADDEDEEVTEKNNEKE